MANLDKQGFVGQEQPMGQSDPPPAYPMQGAPPAYHTTSVTSQPHTSNNVTIVNAGVTLFYN